VVSIIAAAVVVTSEAARVTARLLVVLRHYGGCCGGSNFGSCRVALVNATAIDVVVAVCGCMWWLRQVLPR